MMFDEIRNIEVGTGANLLDNEIDILPVLLIEHGKCQEDMYMSCRDITLPFRQG